MQTLPVGQYQSFDSKHRKPDARVHLIKSDSTLPFSAKFVQVASADEVGIKHIIHSSGRICVVFSKWNVNKYDLYYKRSNVDQTLWDEEVLLLTSTSVNNYTDPTLVEIDGGNIIVVFNKDAILHYVEIEVDGSIEIGETSLTITGNTPSLEKVGSTYWLAYEASGGLKYRTSADASTWGAENNFATGLANSHYYPYLYYDTSDKFWLAFQYVTDPAASPVVENVYYMTSTDNGVNWGSPVAQTSLVAGEGSAKYPSLVDTGSYRYFAYNLLRQISRHDRGADSRVKDVHFDEANNETVFYQQEASISTARIVWYNTDTEVETSLCLSTSGSWATTGVADIRFSYDSTNNRFAVTSSGSNGGVLYYDRNTTQWIFFNSTSTPALPSNLIYGSIFDGNKLYLIYQDSVLYNYHVGYIDLDANTFTSVQSFDSISGSIYSYQPYKTDTYMVFRLTRGSNDFYVVINRDLSSSYAQTVAKTGYGLYHYDGLFLTNTSGIDPVNNYLYVQAQPSPQTETYREHGIVKYLIGASSITEVDYFDNLPSNIYNLLPAPVPFTSTGENKLAIYNMVYGDGNLYIIGQAKADNNAGLGLHIQVFNTTTERVTSYFATTGSSAYATYFPTIDSEINKIIPGSVNWASSIPRYSPVITEDKELIFINGTMGPSPTRSYLNILFIESEASRIYYRRTTDDATWTTQAVLTRSSQDTRLHLGVSTNGLLAFWQRNISGVSNLMWGEFILGEINLSSFVNRFQINKVFNEAYNAEVVFVDKTGRFDPLNYSSLQYDWLQENNIISIEKGNNGNYIQSFYGYITAGGVERKRGDEIVYRINCLDRTKNYLKRKITTQFYENQTITAILNNVAAVHMGLSVGEYDFPTILTVIPTVQFIEEYPMDILKKLLQPSFYFPYFDEHGVLKAKELNYEASTDFTYFKDGTDTASETKAPAFNIASFGFEWDDNDIVNRVVVIGETPELYETEFDEEYMGSIQGAAGWFSTKNNFTFYFSQDKSLHCINPRLSVVDGCRNKFFGGGESLSSPGAGKQSYCTITQRVTNLVYVLYALIAAALACVILWAFGKGVTAVLNPLAYVVATVTMILGQISNFYYEVYAQPIGDAVPDTIIGEADDLELQAKYGIIEEEIDNPFLSSQSLCSILAEKELQRAKWFRYRPQVRVLDNPAIQTGDVINFYNPETNNYYKVYILETTQVYRRGQEDVMDIEGALIQ